MCIRDSPLLPKYYQQKVIVKTEAEDIDTDQYNLINNNIIGSIKNIDNGDLSSHDSTYFREPPCALENQVIMGTTEPTDHVSTITNSGNGEVIGGNSDLTDDDFKGNSKDLPALRKDLNTFHKSYCQKNGGIESIEVFARSFLINFPGYLQLFHRQAIIYEAEKICKKNPSV